MAQPLSDDVRVDALLQHERRGGVQLLDEAGYEHVSIADHKQIAEAILRWKPQCIIVDSDPGSAGHERSWADAAAIRRAHPDLPVLMFTADPAATAEAKAGTSTRSRAAHYAGVLDMPFLVLALGHRVICR